jgi:NADP-dependent 3-hydroxy acid dehydrogenase YdfG
VAALARTARALGTVTVLVNNAGGALGLDPVERGDLAQWQWMYEVNVLGSLRVTQELLPDLDAGGAGTIVMVSSIAGHLVYEGGAGYTAAKHAQSAMTATLRLEVNGRPVRVIEIDPGMVRTEEFSLVRFDGDAERAAAVYAGVTPLSADDVADCIAWAVTRPHHVNVDRIDIRPLAQAAPHKVHRAKLDP